MSDKLLEMLISEVKEIRSNMATKQELDDVRNNMASKQELDDVRSNMAGKQELQDVRNNMAGKQELQDVRSNMAGKQELQAVKSSMATKEDLQKIHNRLDRTETKIDGIVNQVVSNSEKLQQLDNLTEVQKQQAKILDTLSIRSIKQESELRDLQKETELLRK